MNCRRTRTLIDSYLDRELDPATQLEVERHLADCPGCQAHCEQQRTLIGRIHAEATYYRARPAVAATLRATLDKIDAASGSGARPATEWLRFAASMAFAAFVGSGITYWLTGSSAEDLLTQEVVASHVRAQMVAGRITDVSSSDSHTVKPWFNGKLDFAPPVLDLTGQGFTLVGGRLDYLVNRPVAALVYRHRQHLIHLFIWPVTGHPGAPRDGLTRQGYQLFHWSDGRMHYWAVSDLNTQALGTFSNLIREQTTGRPVASTKSGLPAREDLR